MTEDCVVLELTPLRGEENFKPHPYNGILVPLKLRALSDEYPSFLYESSPKEVRSLTYEPVNQCKSQNYQSFHAAL